MNFRPLGERIVVRRADEVTQTKSGLFIPDDAREKPQEGDVVAVGPGARDETGKIVPLDVAVNDRVLFGKWSGSEVEIAGEKLLIMKADEVIGVILQP